MSRMAFLAMACGVATAATLAALLVLQAIQTRQRAMSRIAGLRAPPDGPNHEAAPRRAGVLGLVSALGTLLWRSGILPAATLAQLRQELAAAGFRGADALALFIGGKLVLLPLLPLLAVGALRQTHMAAVTQEILVGGAGIVGLLVPDLVVRRLRARQIAGIERGLPDALDMLVTCTEAGLGLDSGIERVAEEIAMAHPAVAAELHVTSMELRLVADRRVALTNLGTRTGLEPLRRLGGTLIQTLQYGTPLSQALRTLATELRGEMLTGFEARAARLPVLLTVPMILFILPCIFIVVGGPAGLTVLRTFMRH